MTSDRNELRATRRHELLTRRSQSDHRQGPEHGEGRRRGGPVLRRRAVGDALRELDDHREPRRARSGSARSRCSSVRSRRRRRRTSSTMRRLKSAIEQAQELAKRRPDNPELMPLGEAAAGLPADRRRAAGRRRVRAGRARADGQAERRRLREEGRARRRLHPEAALDRCARELRRAVRVLPLRRGELHPHVPHAGRHGLRLGGHDRAEGRLENRRGGAIGSGGGQGAEIAQAARARAGQLHGDPRAAAGGAIAVADAVRAERARRRRRAAAS